MHNLLNRHQGLALLEYAANGAIPTLTETKLSTLITRLEQSLILQNPDIELEERGDIDKFQVRLDGAELNFGVRSCLRDRRLEGLSSAIGVLWRRLDYSPGKGRWPIPRVDHRASGPSWTRRRD